MSFKEDTKSSWARSLKVSNGFLVGGGGLMVSRVHSLGFYLFVGGVFDGFDLFLEGVVKVN